MTKKKKKQMYTWLGLGTALSVGLYLLFKPSKANAATAGTGIAPTGTKPVYLPTAEESAKAKKVLAYWRNINSEPTLTVGLAQEVPVGGTKKVTFAYGYKGSELWYANELDKEYALALKWS